MIDAAPANHRPVVPDRVARVLTEVLSPVVLAYGVCLAVSIGTTPPLRRGVVVGLAVATLTAGLPFAVVLWSSRRGRLSGRHIPVLRQRPLVLVLAAGSTVFAFVATGWLGADPAVRALVSGVVHRTADRRLDLIGVEDLDPRGSRCRRSDRTRAGLRRPSCTTRRAGGRSGVGACAAGGARHPSSRRRRRRGSGRSRRSVCSVELRSRTAPTLMHRRPAT